jgi:hypothetical protein
MKVIILLLTLLLAAGLLGCGKQEARHIVILPDVSGSIERQALEQAFKAIDELVSQLHRGDRIAIIPILGDAPAEASGRIIRFEVPKERRAYDADLRDFRRKLSTSLAEMRASAVGHPGSKTDILGSVELAAQEFESQPGKSARLLLVLSDFIQEDTDLNFAKDRQLGSPANARALAAKLLKGNSINFQKTQVYLGLLRSNEYGSLSKTRRDAIQDFWAEYFRLSHGQAQSVVDGVGLMESSLNGRWQ